MGNDPIDQWYSPWCATATKALPEEVALLFSTISCYISSRIICLAMVEIVSSVVHKLFLSSLATRKYACLFPW